MKTIEIRNIGPLTDTGKIPVSQVMLLIGEQSTGKSTFMKILCFCCWLEKQVMLDAKSVVYKYTHYYRFWNELKKFHHFNDDFFSDNSYINFESDAVRIEMRGKRHNVKMTLTPGFVEHKYNSKLSFLPSERNLLSSIQNVESLYRSKDVDVLFNYILEWGEARSNFDALHPLNLVFADDMKYHYDTKSGDILTLSDGHSRITPYYASSGVQSALPVQVLATYLADVVGTSPKISPVEYLKHVVGGEGEMDEKVLTKIVQELLKSSGSNVPQKLYDAFPTLENVFKKMQERAQYKSFHMFVEELEQNLFPTAQFELVKMLVGLIVGMNDKQAGGKSSIFLTTHSPYVLTAVNVMMLASVAHEKDERAVGALGLDKYILPVEAYSAYHMKDGHLENIVDNDYHFIKGEYLDSVSEKIDQYTFDLNTIIYGDTEREA